MMIVSAADLAPTKRNQLTTGHAAASSPRKRKAKGALSAASASSTASDSDQSLEEAILAQEHEEPPLATPERSDSSVTEDEEDGDEPTRDSVQQAKNLNKPALPKQTPNHSIKPAASPPPRRELPFTRPQASRHPPSASTAPAEADHASGNDEKAEETSDDEL